MEGFSAESIASIFLGLIAFFIYLYVGWIWPILSIQEADKTKKSKVLPSMVLTVFGIGPIIYALYVLWKTHGSAASNATGGNTPPITKVEPQMPSQVTGSENAGAPK